MKRSIAWKLEPLCAGSCSGLVVVSDGIDGNFNGSLMGYLNTIRPYSWAFNTLKSKISLLLGWRHVNYMLSSITFVKDVHLYSCFLNRDIVLLDVDLLFAAKVVYYMSITASLIWNVCRKLVVVFQSIFWCMGHTWRMVWIYLLLCLTWCILVATGSISGDIGGVSWHLLLHATQVWVMLTGERYGLGSISPLFWFWFYSIIYNQNMEILPFSH